MLRRVGLWWMAVVIGIPMTVVAACGSGTPPGQSTPSGLATPATTGEATVGSEAGSSPTEGVEASADPPVAGVPAQIAIASSDLAVGPQRFAFAILDGNNALVPGAKATVKFFRLIGDTTEPAGEAQPATFYPFALAEAGLYVVYTTFDQPGPWGVEIGATLPDGRKATEQRVRFVVAGKTKSVAVGDPAPASKNRTLLTEPDLAKLTSDPQPDPDFYRLTVAEAAGNGKPTLVVFATPGFCQSKTCGPTLEEVKKAKAKWASKINFIHIEVYKVFEPLTFADELGEWGLETEPWVFVLGKDGRVVERMEGSVTDAELEEILAKDFPGL